MTPVGSGEAAPKLGLILPPTTQGELVGTGGNTIGTTGSAAEVAELWRRARESLAGFARSYGWTPELRALLSGVPLPAKANLKVRWARAADREAPYVPVRNPLTGPQAELTELTELAEPALP